MAQQVAGSIMGAFGFGGKVAHEGGLILHSGGLVVPRFHFGGLASDEVPAILQTRERVLSREQATLFEKFANKTDGGAPNVQVNVINQSGTPLSAKQGAMPRFDGRQFVIDVVMDNYNSGGVLRQALAGR
jgi:hypothetical protein